MLSSDKLEQIIQSLLRLNMLDSVNKSFQRDLLASIISPVLKPRTPGQSHEVVVGESGIRIGPSVSTSVSEVFDRITMIIGYLKQHLPTHMSLSLSETTMPVISSKLISLWLVPEVPIGLDGLHDFEKTLDRVIKFCRTVERLEWQGHEELVSWVDQVPRLWLTRRRGDSLDQVRKVLTASKGVTRKVERVEKELVSKKNDVLLEGGATDDWDADWDNENAEELNSQVHTTETGEEEDVSAWGLDDDTEESHSGDAEAAEDDEAGDAWGWGDDEEDQNREKAAPAIASKKQNGTSTKQSSSPKEITLTEYYTVTDIPDSVIALIQRQISDSGYLSKAE
jgi:centromere/kinetochore protein ZW10